MTIKVETSIQQTMERFDSLSLDPQPCGISTTITGPATPVVPVTKHSKEHKIVHYNSASGDVNVIDGPPTQLPSGVKSILTLTLVLPVCWFITCSVWASLIPAVLVICHISGEVLAHARNIHTHLLADVLISVCLKPIGIDEFARYDLGEFACRCFSLIRERPVSGRTQLHRMVSILIAGRAS